MNVLNQPIIICILYMKKYYKAFVCMLGIILDQRGLRCWKRFCRHSETGPIASGLILQSGSGAYGGFLSPDPCILRHYGLHGELENAYMCINYRNNFNSC